MEREVAELREHATSSHAATVASASGGTAAAAERVRLQAEAKLRAREAELSSFKKNVGDHARLGSAAAPSVENADTRVKMLMQETARMRQASDALRRKVREDSERHELQVSSTFRICKCSIHAVSLSMQRLEHEKEIAELRRHRCNVCSEPTSRLAT